MDFRLHFLPSEALEESGHHSVGLQTALVRDWAGGRLAIGADLEHTRGYLVETQERPTIFSFVQGEHYDYEAAADVAALYVQARRDLSDTLSVQAGLRWEATRYDYDNRLTPGSVGRFLRLPDRSDDFSVVAAPSGHDWQADENSAVFARIARGSPLTCCASASSPL